MDGAIKNKKRALVLGSGGLAGAYAAGFASKLNRELGNEYFDSVYCYSVGSTIGTFFVANQPEVIENTWKKYVSGKQLVKPLNFLKGKPLLDLDYLISLFQGERSKLNIDAVFSSKVNLQYILIDYYSWETNYFKPNRENIFDLIKGCCSLPIIHGPSEVDGKLFLDATFVCGGGLPLLEEIVQKYDEVLVILNFPRDYKSNIMWWPVLNIFFPIASYFYPKRLRAVFKQKRDRWEKIFECEKGNNNVKIIAPYKLALDYGGDSDEKNIHDTFDLGKRDAEEFIANIPIP